MEERKGKSERRNKILEERRQECEKRKREKGRKDEMGGGGED